MVIITEIIPMFNLFIIGTVARIEAKLLLRSWAFRIFSVLGITILVFMNIGLGTTLGHAPHFLRSLSGSLPLMNVKLLNIYQGIIVIFLATEFFKRDHRHDTTQVMFARSFSNIDYVIGKVIGILSVFGALNFVVMLFVFTIHFFFSPTPFAWAHYFYYPLLIGLPTLIFMIGASLFLITIVRSQAVVFIIMLGLSLLSLMVIGTHQYFIFDCFAFYQPLVYSDFIGLGNTWDLLMVRGAYLLVGLGLISLTAFATKRLRQSPAAMFLSAAFSIVTITLAAVSGYVYLDKQSANAEYRDQLKATNSDIAAIATVSVTDYEINIDFKNDLLIGTAAMATINNQAVALDSILLTLNPGLSVNEVMSGSQAVDYRQEEFLIWVKPPSPLEAGDSLNLTITYSGSIDDRYCYLDIGDERFWGAYRMWLYTIPKKYSFVTSDYLHLTPEVGWYPISGIRFGAAFPAIATNDYSRYRLSLTIPERLTAISQGSVTIDSSAGQHTYNFDTGYRMPQISLTVGRYEKMQLTVDSVDYAIYFHPDHDYFSPFFEEIQDTIPEAIRQLKNEFEVALGMEYPHRRLSLVEVPIQLYGYRRIWTTAQEFVQPELVYLPELGTICAGADFRQMKRSSTRSQERANQADSPREIQTEYFNTFVRIELLGFESSRRGISRNESIEPSFAILPNYISYMTHISSERCPVLNYAFESYFKNRIAPPQDTRGRNWRGLTGNEKGSLALKEISLADLIKNQDLYYEILPAAVKLKGRFLLSYLEAKTEGDDFYNRLKDLLRENRYRDISEDNLNQLAASLGVPDFDDIIDSWYSDTLLPGFMISDVESFKLLVGERIKTQVRFTIANPTDADGVIDLNMRYRRRGMNFTPRWMRNVEQSDYSQTILLPAQTRKKIGIILDQPPAEMTFDTYASRNIPSIISIPFQEQKTRKNVNPFEGEITEVISPDDSSTIDEYIVDNEDDGFSIIGFIKENILRRTLLDLFGNDDPGDPYVGMRFWDPPGQWTATTNQNFYGQFVRSGYFKQSGDGENVVEWRTELDNSGDYDIYYYCENSMNFRMWRRHGRRGTENLGEKRFMIYHDDGVDDVPLDLNGIDEGWNYLGTFRLSAGNNRVQLTDENREREFVTADAVKWVKR